MFLRGLFGNFSTSHGQVFLSLGKCAYRPPRSLYPQDSVALLQTLADRTTHIKNQLA